MADVKWIKLIVGMFDGMSFKKIKKAKIGGESFRDKLTAVWFELMDFAGRCNHDGAFISPREIPFYELSDIATMIDREEEELRLCMAFFIKEGMISVIDDVYMLSNWSEYQNTDGLEKIKQQNRLRQAKFKQKQKLLASNVTDNVTDNVTVTQSNATDKDIDKERDKEEEKENIYSSVIDYLNQKASTKYKATTAKTKSVIHARQAEGFTLDDFKTVIDKKCAEWIGTDYEKFLRPETLFGTKFEGYLNANTNRKGVNNGSIEKPNDGITDEVGTWL